MDNQYIKTNKTMKTKEIEKLQQALNMFNGTFQEILVRLTEKPEPKKDKTLEEYYREYCDINGIMFHPDRQPYELTPQHKHGLILYIIEQLHEGCDMDRNWVIYYDVKSKSFDYDYEDKEISNPYFCTQENAIKLLSICGEDFLKSLFSCIYKIYNVYL